MQFDKWQPTKWFCLHRCLRHRDPSLPYLFLLCAEGLSSLIVDLTNRNLLHGIQIYNGAPRVSHLFLADDNILFVRANANVAQRVLDTLSTNEHCYGKVVSYKSEVSFS